MQPKIIQIVIKEDRLILGLGEDSKVYMWNYENHIWSLYPDTTPREATTFYPNL